MNLREFIEETVSSIADAVVVLQNKYEPKGMIINPPTRRAEPTLYHHDDKAVTHRRIESVEFDVAVTASSETSGGGKAGLRVLSAEAGVKGGHVRSSEEVSHVRFVIPIALPPSQAEVANRQLASEQDRRLEEDRTRSRPC